jgi:hypothetical protein
MGEGPTRVPGLHWSSPADGKGIVPLVHNCVFNAYMKTAAEIEDAIRKPTPAQVDELAAWLEAFRRDRATPTPIEAWLGRARGAARPGVTTADIIAMTRGDDTRTSSLP